MNQEILTKAIEKALRSGWDHYDKSDVLTNEGIKKTSGTIMGGPYFWSGIIFNHEFAKALWGDKPIAFTMVNSLSESSASRAWQYHLQHMVIADDPIKYLGENI